MSAGRWYVEGRADLGRFASEGEALARAWEITPAGEARPEVRQRPEVPPSAAEPQLPRAAARQQLGVALVVDQRHVKAADPARVQSQLLDQIRARAETEGMDVDWGTLRLTEDEDARMMTVTYRAVVEAVAWAGLEAGV